MSTRPGEDLAMPCLRSVRLVDPQELTAAGDCPRGWGFTDPLPPIVGPVTDPGARGAKQVDVDYYGHRYKLMTSAILYKQASLTAFDKIFCIAPNVRLEPLETAMTDRHLVEFHQIDVEVAEASRDDIMQLAEHLVGHVVAETVTQARGELDALGRNTAAFARLLSEPFGRRTHADAVADLHGMGHPQNPDAAIDWPGPAMLSRPATNPLFIPHHPTRP